MDRDTHDIAVAKYEYTAEGEGELTIKKNEKLIVLDDSQPWWKVSNEQNQTGYVPSNYMTRKDSVKGKKKGNIIETLKDKVGRSKNRSSASDPDLSATTGDISSPKLSKSGKKVVQVAVAKFKYVPQRDDELEMNRGETILVLEMENDGWWRGENSVSSKNGWFPYNYVEKKEEDFNRSVEYSDPQQDPVTIEILGKVRTLYPFNSQAPEELSFEKDAVLEIIEKPKDDPDWWQARKSTGESGLVPRNYVEELASSILTPGPDKPNKVTPIQQSSSSSTSSSPAQHEFADRDWYHGAVTRQECERRLNTYAENGEFLLRNSESKPGDYSLSMKAPDRIKHFKIGHQDAGSYVIGQRTFASMDDLIAHYQKAPIYTTDQGQKMFLTKSFNKAMNALNANGAS